jgi:hypothetical protein
MITKTVTTLTDDIDGSTDDVVTCAFGLGDSHFEIDLNVTHREELESVLAKFVESARPVSSRRSSRHAGPSRQTPKPKTGTVDREQTHAIRQWAKGNGYQVSERGRISKAIVDAYEEAH